MTETKTATKKIVKLRKENDAQPTLVDNPEYAAVQSMLGFTAGKARAVTNLMSDLEKVELYTVLQVIKELAVEGSNQILVHGSPNLETLSSLEKLGYKVTTVTKKKEYFFSWFRKPKTTTHFKITW